jgi:hypothetical protein
VRAPAPFHVTGDTNQYRYFSTSGLDAVSHARLLRDSRPLERLDELVVGTFSRVEAYALTFACGYARMSSTSNIGGQMPLQPH